MKNWKMRIFQKVRIFIFQYLCLFFMKNLIVVIL
jgi:hypothetical protein